MNCDRCLLLLRPSVCCRHLVSVMFVPDAVVVHFSPHFDYQHRHHQLNAVNCTIDDPFRNHLPNSMMPYCIEGLASCIFYYDATVGVCQDFVLMAVDCHSQMQLEPLVLAVLM